MPVDLISYLYAATVAAGGIAGYVKAGMTLNRSNIDDVFDNKLNFFYFNQRFHTISRCWFGVWRNSRYDSAKKTSSTNTKLVIVSRIYNLNRISIGYGAHLNSQSPPKPLFQLGRRAILSHISNLLLWPMPIACHCC